MLINVKTALDCKAFTEPSGGREIPTDRYMAVQLNDWVAHLIEIGNLLMQPQEEAAQPLPLTPTEAVTAAVNVAKAATSNK